MLRLFFVFLLTLLAACDEPDPVEACNDVAAAHCDRVSDCAVTPQDIDACVVETRVTLGCDSAVDTTSSLSRCQRGIDEPVCTDYSRLPTACFGAFSAE